MFQPIFDAFERLVTDFSRRRILLLLGFLAFIGVSIAVFEYYTAYFRMNRLDRAASLLKDLSELSQTPGIQGSTVLATIRDSIAGQLRDVLVQQASLPRLSPSLLGMLVAAAPWLLFALLFLSSMRRGDKSAVPGFYGALVCAVIFGLLSLLLPPGTGASIRFIIYPVGHFVLLAIVATWWQSRKQRAA
jgi:hypothetical protein